MSGCTYSESRSDNRKHVLGIGVRETSLHVANHSLGHETGFWKTLLMLQFLFCFFFSPHNQPTFTSLKLKGKIPPRHMELFWVQCSVVLCPLSELLNFSGLPFSYKQNNIFSFVSCLFYLLKNKTNLFQHTTQWRISSLQQELRSKQIQIRWRDTNVSALV